MQQCIYRLREKIVGNRLRVLATLLVCLGSSYAQDNGYDTPILELPEDVCEVEIAPEMVDLLLYDPKTFYTLLTPAPCEPLPTRYKCKGCRDKNATVYECYHETMDPRTPCSTDRCIKNVVKTKSCYVSDSGAEDCRVLFDQAGDPDNAENNWVVQYIIKLPIGVQCRTNNQYPQLWFKSYVGCPNCTELSFIIRCRTDRCRGQVEEVLHRRGRYVCSPQPCPRPISTDDARLYSE